MPVFSHKPSLIVLCRGVGQVVTLMSSSENITLFSSASFIIGGVAATIVTPLVIACPTILCVVPF
jgi:hypothetical protein